MPTSSWLPVSWVMEKMFRHFGKKRGEIFFDIGPGFGRWGLLAREMGDLIKGRVKKEQWFLKVNAIEIYEYYNTNYLRLYDYVAVGDFRSKLPEYLKVKGVRSIDHIMFGDVLEHVSKQDALKVLDLCFNKLVRNTIFINIPLGPRWKQGEVGGNKNEAHISTWEVSDFPHYKEWLVDYKIYRDFKNREYLSLFAKGKRNV